ncbi:glycine zipper domain-containing protein [Microvirga sp. VF16]|uniref:glycine zipper domain-containing protein n=1 Tax=Microvirga sp. VF16 TaxID=2807101 RepID=UPI00193E7DDF|nr:glycine zipper domain-containing protein [Microvirga sp. VF16]QRM28315.1 hypothetical protein JO965_19035 [Microvirga sp. VF16]
MRAGMKYAALAVTLLFPTLAVADPGGAAAGAAAGGAVGAVVGGPVGAAVGAGVGGATGDAASGPDQKNIVIENRDVGTTGSTGCSTTTKQTTDVTGTTTKQKTEC